MLLPLAIYTANHGLGWSWPQSDVALSELEKCRTAFGDLPDFDFGDIGFEGVAVLGERVFVARCFQAMKWDFRGRDAIYLAVTWFSMAEARIVDLEALLKLPPFLESMRDPPCRFECPTVSETGGVSLLNLLGELPDGITMRRNIGEKVFTPVSSMAVPEEQESLPNEPPPPLPHGDDLHPALKRKWQTILMWVLLTVAMSVALVLSWFVLLKGTVNKEGVADDGSGKIVERRGTPESCGGTNDVPGRTVFE